jgi:CRP-like cAMP-binding protein
VLYLSRAIIGLCVPTGGRYILKSGSAVATKNGYDFELEYQAGDFFGELSLLTPNPRAASIHARGTAVVLTMCRSQFMLLVRCARLHRRRRHRRLSLLLSLVASHVAARHEFSRRWAKQTRCYSAMPTCIVKLMIRGIDTWRFVCETLCCV